MISLIKIMIVMLVIMGVAIGYLYYHIDRLIKWKMNHKWISAIVLIVVLLTMFLSSLFLGFVIHLFIAFIFVDLIYFVVRKTKLKKYIHVEMIALLIACLLSGYGFYNVNHMQYIQYDVYIDKQFEDKRILAISDLHLSTAVFYQDLWQIKQKVKTRDIDMIFILGDFFDEGTDENEAKKAISFFDELTSLCPVYYIVGNHDGSQGQVPVDEGLLKSIDESRIVFLKDEVVNVQGMSIIGRLDRSYQRKDMEKLMTNVKQDQPVILLDHQPRDTRLNGNLGVDLQLSGHTHNGQVFPLGTLCRFLHINEVEYGHVQIDDMDVIVSSGMGTWGFALKSQGKCEMVEIDLKRK